jgi:NAD(P)-dependent dehydrogenase (short-subunit alcohol dehydrogenase family)
MQLQGQVALVTGAGRGIGKAIALRFAREGADVAIVDLNSEWAQATGDEIKSLGRRVFVKPTDVSVYDQIQATVAEAAVALGKIDILVNNAGIGRAQRFLEITKDNWERHLHIHLFGTFYCAQAAAREMAKQNYGASSISLPSPV